MKFCTTCNNMFYVKVNENKELVYYCKFCNNSHTETKENGSILVIDDNTVDDDIKYKQFLNKNILHDPTLPRVNNIVCTNESCTKNKNEDNEVIYVKYDFENMKYLYCT